MWWNRALNTAPFSRFALSRTRSSSGDTPWFRLRVRDVLRWFGFLLAKALPSTVSSGSASVGCPSFDGFPGSTTFSDFPQPFIAALRLGAFSARTGFPFFSGELRDLPVPAHETSTRAEGLRPRRSRGSLAMSRSAVLPSASLNSVGDPVVFISWLNTSPASSPVNASGTSLRMPSHDSGPG